MADDDELPDGTPELQPLPAAWVGLSPLELAELGLSVTEIAKALGITEAQSAAAIGPVTPAQVNRVEHTLVARAIGANGLAPHVQAGQVVLGAYRPDVYGRQTQGGQAVVRVIVDRGYTLRRGVTVDSETVPAIEPSPGT